MTELEIMQRAKMYMDKLAQGIDPVTDTELPEDSALNNIRLARCFFYVSGVLEQVIQNGGQVGKLPRKAEFTLTSEQLSTIQPSEEPLRITQFVELLQGASGNPGMKRPSTRLITDWLMEKGFLQNAINGEGKQYRAPTETGNRIGIHAVNRQGMNGVYTAVLYDATAQQFILDHFSEIMAKQK